MKTVIAIFVFLSSLYANALQDAIDRASPHATIKLQSGTYIGPIKITKPLRIIGLTKGVIIDGNGDGSVVTITSRDVELDNLTLQNSGSNMQKIDAAISMIHADYAVVKNCKLYKTLYGIDMYMVHHALIVNNHIKPRDEAIELRGNALKLFYAHHNTIKNNFIQNARDVSLDYSNDNLLQANTFVHNRFATHISLSRGNRLIGNSYKYNSVAILLMGAKDTQIIKNQILSSNGAAGIGVMIGGVENLLLRNNRISFNAKGLYIEGKEREKGMKRYIIGNEISYNKEAIHFHASIKENTIKRNAIFANIDDVVKDTGGDFQLSNVVEYNYWDRYSGFDRDGNGIGDEPYRVYQYADQLWQYNNKVKFFYASPIMTLLDFLSQLAPFIEPHLILVDKKPTYQLPSPF